MSGMSATRRLAAIAVANVADYARLLNADEAETLGSDVRPLSEVGPSATWQL